MGGKETDGSLWAGCLDEEEYLLLSASWFMQRAQTQAYVCVSECLLLWNQFNKERSIGSVWQYIEVETEGSFGN